MKVIEDSGYMSDPKRDFKTAKGQVFATSIVAG